MLVTGITHSEPRLIRVYAFLFLSLPPPHPIYQIKNAIAHLSHSCGMLLGLALSQHIVPWGMFQTQLGWNLPTSGLLQKSTILTLKPYILKGATEKE